MWFVLTVDVFSFGSRQKKRITACSGNIFSCTPTSTPACSRPARRCCCCCGSSLVSWHSGSVHLSTNSGNICANASSPNHPLPSARISTAKSNWLHWANRFFPHVFPPTRPRQIKLFHWGGGGGGGGLRVRGAFKAIPPSIHPFRMHHQSVCMCSSWAADHTSAELAMHLLETPHSFLRHFEVVMLRLQRAAFKDNLQGFISAHPPLFLPAFPALTSPQSQMPY